jgi:hypothetical protein
MRTLRTLLLVGFLASTRVDGWVNSVAAAGTPGQTVETIVCFRHGEKPPGGLGQLTCRGLNRALALPDVLLPRYGAPQFVFAPNPTQKVDGNASYYYVRPLMTIEPTAVRCGLPVNVQFGYKEIKGLEAELQKPQYQNATIFVSWEHALLDEFVKDLLKTNGGNAAEVPAWPGSDYDTIFVVRIIQSDGAHSAIFAMDHEGLNNLNDACPRVAP